MLNIYGFFHFNLAFSSIEEDAQIDVINKCYLPLLNFIEESNVPFGIELSGYTLERINLLAPEWIDKFIALHAKGLVDLIGCGYSQIIGPLLPYRVTEENLKIGNQIYEKYFSLKPKIALINEQAFSRSMVSIYKESGYHSVIMEWNNPYKYNPSWNREWRYQPQFISNKDDKIATIWNDTIAFQKFQRYVHGEISLQSYLNYIESVNVKGIRNFPIYGSDIEVINFRPGRFDTETDLVDGIEWGRIRDLFEALKNMSNISLIKPSDVIDLSESKDAFNTLNLTNSEQPIVVKKQPKYNVTRWALSGRNDIDINTRCWNLYKALINSKEYDQEDWKELCYLWSSDFRTHITESRWSKYNLRIKEFEKLILFKNSETTIAVKNDSSLLTDQDGSSIHYNYRDNFLCIHGKRLSLKLNCLKGLSIQEFSDLKVYQEPLFGTLEHGHFDDIEWGVDFFSSHLVYEIPGSHKITDIQAVNPRINLYKNSINLEVTINTRLGELKKYLNIDDITGEISINYKLSPQKNSIGSLRYGFVTLFLDSFDKNSLCFEAHNGGKDLERFNIKDTDFDHGKPVSKLVSSNNILGLTEGILRIGDKDKKIVISIDKTLNASAGMVQCRSIKDKRLIRAFLSARETDETSKAADGGVLEVSYKIKATS